MTRGAGKLSLVVGPNELNKQLCTKSREWRKKSFHPYSRAQLQREEDEKHGKSRCAGEENEESFSFLSSLSAHPKKRVEIAKRFGARSARRSENFSN